MSDLLVRYAQQTGMTVRRVPWAEAQRDKEESRRRDQADIAAGRATPEEVTVRNSGGMANRQLVVIDDSRAYL